MKHTAVLLCIFTELFFVQCSRRPADGMTDEELRADAIDLAHKFIITDGHIDLPDRLYSKGIMITPENLNTILSTDQGDFDYERAKKGGLDAPFMSIYIPAEHQLLPDHGKMRADSLIDIVQRIASQLPDKFALANSPREVEENFRNGKISLPMGMENGAPIGDDLNNLKYFYDRGIRYITLTHNKDNQICDGSRYSQHTWNGLSPYGRRVVEEMNRLGIMIDISHVDDSTFYQVMKLTKAPCIASHSSCRAFSPAMLRDMTDDMIKKLGENGGVMQINFYNPFLDSAVVNHSNRNKQKLEALLAGKKLKETDSLARPVIAQFKKDNPPLRTSIEMVANHIDHVVKIAGIDHVAIGSDFDGVEGELPIGLEDVSTYPNLVYTLLKRGYTETDIEKICYKNVWRVWNRVEAVSKELQK